MKTQPSPAEIPALVEAFLAEAVKEMMEKHETSVMEQFAQVCMHNQNLKRFFETAAMSVADLIQKPVPPENLASILLLIGISFEVGFRTGLLHRDL